MRSVFQRLLSFISLLLVLATTDGCGLNPFASGETRYRVQTIQNMPLQEFLETRPGFPTELRFNAMPPDSDYRGRIKLGHGAWKAIDSGDKASFTVPVEEIDGAFFLFSQLDIQEDILSGMCGLTGPTIFSIPYPFTAKRE